MKSVSTKVWENNGQEEGKASSKVIWKRIDPQSQTPAKMQLQLHTSTSAGDTREGRAWFSSMLMAQYFSVSGLTDLKIE